MNSSYTDDINKRLLEYYGRDVVWNRPIYRVVWSSSQRETRFAEYEDWYNQVIFLRKVKEWRETLKYPQNPDRWVLERIFPNPRQDELLGEFSYEPLFVFQDKNGNYLPPVWNAINLILYTLHTQNAKKAKSNEEMELSKEKEAARREEEEILDSLIQSDYELASKVHDGEGIFVPSNSLIGDN